MSNVQGEKIDPNEQDVPANYVGAPGTGRNIELGLRWFYSAE